MKVRTLAPLLLYHILTGQNTWFSKIQNRFKICKMVKDDVDFSLRAVEILSASIQCCNIQLKKRWRTSSPSLPPSHSEADVTLPL